MDIVSECYFSSDSIAVLQCLDSWLPLKWKNCSHDQALIILLELLIGCQSGCPIVYSCLFIGFLHIYYL